MILSTVELFLVSFGLTYLAAMTIAGLRVLRESGTRPARRPAHRRSVLPDPGPARRRWRRLCGQITTAEQPAVRATVMYATQEYQVYYLVPCLNEELVIGRTVSCLLADARARVIVIDDASDDRTAELARATAPDRVLVVRRELPDARAGKGPALNAGLARILQDAAARHISPAQVIVCVMDADGELSPGTREAVLPLFADPQVGGVQLPVRIRNRDQGVLPLLQDVLFWGLSAVSQLGRVRSGTVSLGGNGQFTRLAALLDLGREPWRRCLTEDLDLSLALTARGWRMTATADAFVSQQGVTTTRALLKQWTRWYQGHMTSARWLPSLWSSRRLSHLAMLEITLFLMVPWTLVLPWSVLFHYSLYLMIIKVSGWRNSPVLGTDGIEHAATLLLWYAMSFSPNWIVGYLYYRQDRRSGFWRSVLIGHVLLAANYVAYAAAWRALYRMITGRSSWAKTSRHLEDGGKTLPVLAELIPAPRAAEISSATAAVERTDVMLIGAGLHRDDRDLVAVGLRDDRALVAARPDEGALVAVGGRAAAGRHRAGSHRAGSTLSRRSRPPHR